MTRKGRRLTLIGSALGIAGIAAGLVLFALRDSIVFFYSPAEVIAKGLGPGTRLRLGGLVEQGSVEHLGANTVSFTVTDLSKTMKVTYTGLLPDLFREGQGIVAEGVLDGPTDLRADQVLAKHDERYMPRDVADKLKKQGLWREGDQARTPAHPNTTATATINATRRGEGLMINETGHFALVLALALALVQSVLPIWGTWRRDPSLVATAVPVAFGQFVLIAYAFGALMHAHIVSDFSVVNVVENSHSLKPLIYKISGVWGNHEGSMLLWVLILAIFGALVATFGRGMAEDLRANTLAVQAWIAAAFLLFILLTSDPFTRALQPPIEGQDLNPLLQDPGLAIHPPMLYLGYVGFSIVFSFAAAALISGRVDAAWARYVRPWVLLAWIFLTLGIAMGSYWAYYTLGWGGFWFWDPVENASLMPWLAGTALLHCTAVMEKRDALKVWTLFLAILTFSLSLLGTFLVRSGVLTSVHSFANDPTRGVFILLILVVFIGGSLALYAWRAPALQQGGLFAPISREGSLVLNNLLLTTCCATVFTGTLYPLALEALTGDKISVGAPFFNLTFGPLMIAVLLAVPIGQSLAWKRGDLLGAAQRLTVAMAAGVIVGALLLAFRHGGPTLAPLGVALAVYLIVGAFTEVVRRSIVRGASAAVMLGRAVGLPRSTWGAAFAHAGLGLTLMGLAATGWGVERITTIKPGESVDLGPYQASVLKSFTRQGPNYIEAAMSIDLRKGGIVVATVEPSKRNFTTRQMAVTQAGIATLDLGQVYISLGDTHPDGSIDARLFWKPLVTLIWLGAMTMGFGGLLSLSDRRLRIGFARRAVSRPGPLYPHPAE